MAKKKETLMDAAKSTIGLGIVSGAGMGVMGANIPGMPAMSCEAEAGMRNVRQTAFAGIGLANVGRLGKTGMTIANTLTGSSRKKTGNKFIDNII